MIVLISIAKFRRSPDAPCCVTSFLSCNVRSSTCSLVFVGNHCTHVFPTACTHWGTFEAGCPPPHPSTPHGAGREPLSGVCVALWSDGSAILLWLVNSSSLEDAPTVTWLDYLVRRVCKDCAHFVTDTLPSLRYCVTVGALCIILILMCDYLFGKI